jgi:hypothetical protein
MNVAWTLLITVASTAVGCFITWLVARRVPHRRIISIRLEEAFRVNAQDFGLGERFAITYDRSAIPCLIGLKLTVTGVSGEDFVSSPSASALNPNIVLKGFTVLGFRTLNKDDTKFYIPLSVGVDGAVWTNINRLRAGTKAEFMIICRKQSPDESEGFVLRNSFLPNFSVVGAGLLKK